LHFLKLVGVLIDYQHWIKGIILKYRVPSLWPTYLGERRTTFAKAYGIKLRCYGEHVGEHVEEHIGNLKGT